MVVMGQLGTVRLKAVLAEGGRVDLREVQVLRDRSLMFALRVDAGTFQMWQGQSAEWVRSKNVPYSDVAALATWATDCVLVAVASGEDPDTHVFSAGHWPQLIVRGDVPRE